MGDENLLGPSATCLQFRGHKARSRGRNNRLCRTADLNLSQHRVFDLKPLGRGLLHPVSATHGVGNAAAECQGALCRESVVNFGNPAARFIQNNVKHSLGIGCRVVKLNMPAVE